MLEKRARTGGVMLVGILNKAIGIKPNLSNPWRMISWAQGGVRETENELTNGVLGKSQKDPNILRQLLFMFMALIGYGYMYEDETVKRTEANKKAAGRTNNLALPAELATA